MRQSTDHLMDTCPYVSEHYKAILRATRQENFRELLAFTKENEASPKQHPDSNQMVKLLQAFDEKVDQLGEEVRQRDCKMVTIDPQAINEQQAQTVRAQTVQVLDAQVQ